MTAEEIKMVDDLRRVTFLPASWDKSFFKSMLSIRLYCSDQYELTVRQSRCLKIMHQRYRRQHGAAECMENPGTKQ
jgi:hypothetical protein